MSIKDVVIQGGMAVGNLVAGESDRPKQEGSVEERVKKRVRAVAGDGVTKTAASVGAPHAAREIAKRVGQGVIGRVAAGLAARPMVAAGAALFAVDVVKDTARVIKGDMKPSHAMEHLGGSATGIVGGAGGAYAGAILGTVLIPVPFVGAIVGSLAGSVAGSLAGDSVGRTAIRKALGNDTKAK